MNGWEGRHIGEEWLTYQQAGDRLGITSEAARQRARRFGWRHQRGNDGRTLIQLPVDAGAQTAVQTPDKPAVQTPGQTPVQTVALSGWDNGGEALRELVHVLRDQLAKAEERERDARQQAREERERSAAAEARAGDAQDRAAAAEQHAGELRRLLDDELTALRADLALATARAATGPGQDRSTAIGHRPLSRWSWLRGFTRGPGG